MNITTHHTLRSALDFQPSVAATSRTCATSSTLTRASPHAASSTHEGAPIYDDPVCCNDGELLQVRGRLVS